MTGLWAPPPATKVHRRHDLEPNRLGDEGHGQLIKVRARQPC